MLRPDNVEEWIILPLQIVVKSTYKSNKGVLVTRRVRLANPTYERMRELVAATRGEGACVEYVDPQGDVVSVTSWLEWQECVRVFLAEGSSVRINLVRSKKTRRGTLEHADRIATQRAAWGGVASCIAVEDRWADVREALQASLGRSVLADAMESREVAGRPSWVRVHPHREALLVSRLRIQQLLSDAPASPLLEGAAAAPPERRRRLSDLASPAVKRPCRHVPVRNELPWCVRAAEADAVPPAAALPWVPPPADPEASSGEPSTSLGWLHDGTPDVVSSSSFASTFASTPGPTSLQPSAHTTPVAAELPAALPRDVETPVDVPEGSTREARGCGVASLTTDLFSTAVEALLDAARALQSVGFDSDSESEAAGGTEVAPAEPVRRPIVRDPATAHPALETVPPVVVSSHACGLRKRPRSASVSTPATAQFAPYEHPSSLPAYLQDSTARTQRPTAAEMTDKRPRRDLAPFGGDACTLPLVGFPGAARHRTPSETSLPTSPRDEDDDALAYASPPTAEVQAQRATATDTTNTARSSSAASLFDAPPRVAQLDPHLFVDRPLSDALTLCCTSPAGCTAFQLQCVRAMRAAVEHMQHLLGAPGSPPRSPLPPPRSPPPLLSPQPQEMPKLITWPRHTAPPAHPTLRAVVPAPLSRRPPSHTRVVLRVAPRASGMPARPRNDLGLRARMHPKMHGVRCSVKASGAPVAAPHTPARAEDVRAAVGSMYRSMAPGACRHPWQERGEQVHREGALRKEAGVQTAPEAPSAPPTRREAHGAGDRSYLRHLVSLRGGCVPNTTPWLQALCNVFEQPVPKVKVEVPMHHLNTMRAQRLASDKTPWLDSLCSMFAESRRHVVDWKARQQKLITAGPSAHRGSGDAARAAAAQRVTAARYAVHKLSEIAAGLEIEHSLRLAQSRTEMRYALHRLQAAHVQPPAPADLTPAQSVTAARYALHATEDLRTAQDVTRARYAMHVETEVVGTPEAVSLVEAAQATTTARYTLHAVRDGNDTETVAAAQQVTAARYALHGAAEEEASRGSVTPSDGEETLSEDATALMGVEAASTDSERQAPVHDQCAVVFDDFDDDDDDDDDFDEVCSAAMGCNRQRERGEAGTPVEPTMAFPPPRSASPQEARSRSETPHVVVLSDGQEEEHDTEDDFDASFERVEHEDHDHDADSLSDFEIIDTPDVDGMGVRGDYSAEVDRLRGLGVTAPREDIVDMLCATDGDTETTMYALLTGRV